MLSHKGVRWIAFGWSAFIAENLFLSHNRATIIETFGEQGYHVPYSCLSTAANASIVYGYLRYGRRQGPRIFSRTFLLYMTPLAWALQCTGLALASQLAPKLQNPMGGKCPFDFGAKHSGDGSDHLTAAQRVTRHPMLWSFGMLGLGTALTTPFASEIVLFAMPCVFAAIGGQHQDYRFRRGNGGSLSPSLDAATSSTPFVALLQGRQSWSEFSHEVKWGNAGIAVGLGTLLLAARFGRGLPL